MQSSEMLHEMTIFSGGGRAQNQESSLTCGCVHVPDRLERKSLASNDSGHKPRRSKCLGDDRLGVYIVHSGTSDQARLPDCSKQECVRPAHEPLQGLQRRLFWTSATSLVARSGHQISTETTFAGSFLSGCHAESP